MAASYRVFFFFALASCFTVTFTNANKKINLDEEINLRVAFVSNAKPVNVTCRSGGFFALRNTENHTWTVPINMVETCQALWGHSSANFVAFDPDTDSGKPFIYWFAKFDGFFHSYDNITWEKRASWN